MPASEEVRKRNMAIVAEYHEGNRNGNVLSMKMLGERHGLPLQTVATMIRVARTEVTPTMKSIQKEVESRMAAKIEKAIERQIMLGESMIDRAQSEVANVEVQNAGQLSTLAKTGSDIVRVSYGLEG